MNVVETLRELVAINSVSSRSNAEIIRYLASRLEACGLRPQYLSYTDQTGVEKTNLYALAGGANAKGAHDPPAEATLALVGHTDTVPFGADWADALRLTARDCIGETRLYGRGACDTKGFIAAALAALEAVDLNKLTRPLAVIFTADEEVGCIGAKHFAEQRLFIIRNAIVGEPTSLQPVRAGKGYCLADVTVRGREGHSAHPERGASAVFRAARLINRIERVSEELKAEQHEAFDPPHTTINIGVIRGGTAKNVLAGECRFTLEWRTIPNQDPQLVPRLIEREIVLLREEDAGYECVVDVTRTDGGVETSADAPLVHWMKEISGRSARTVSFGTEAPQIRTLGADAVVFGPGDIRTAHTAGEYVPQVELERCAEILRQAVERFCR